MNALRRTFALAAAALLAGSAGPGAFAHFPPAGVQPVQVTQGDMPVGLLLENRARGGPVVHLAQGTANQRYAIMQAENPRVGSGSKFRVQVPINRVGAGDPIVSPNSPSSEHLHQFVGLVLPEGFDMDPGKVTQLPLLSTSEGGASHAFLGWTPVLRLDDRGGTWRLPDVFNVYYQGGARDLELMPDGLEMIGRGSKRYFEDGRRMVARVEFPEYVLRRDDGTLVRSHRELGPEAEIGAHTLFWDEFDKLKRNNPRKARRYAHVLKVVYVLDYNGLEAGEKVSWSCEPMRPFHGDYIARFENGLQEAIVKSNQSGVESRFMDPDTPSVIALKSYPERFRSPGGTPVYGHSGWLFDDYKTLPASIPAMPPDHHFGG